MIRDMKVACTSFAPFEHESTDWKLACTYATFSHEQACEFIFFVGTNLEVHKLEMEKYESLGFSGEMRNACRNAFIAGFEYLCLYN